MYSSYHICSTIATQQKLEKKAPTPQQIFFSLSLSVLPHCSFFAVHFPVPCSFFTSNQLTIELFVPTPATVQCNELRNWVSKQPLCRMQTFIWDMLRFFFFGMIFFRPWSQNIRNAQFSLGHKCLREMHMHCRRDSELACTKRRTWCCSLVYPICAINLMVLELNLYVNLLGISAIQKGKAIHSDLHVN